MPDLAGQRTIKRFRVAREGQTVDGRAISRQHILEMANTYDPVEYTARINVEHSSGWGGLSSDNYPILGDVIAVDAQLDEYTINGVKVQLMGLYATLSVLPQLVEANKQGQKLFTSIEFYPKFADTNQAYLVGLAVTDIPASRGTEPLKFNNTANNTLFSEHQELILMTTQANQTQTPTTATTEGQATIEQAPVPTQTPQPPAQPQQHKTEDGFLQKMANMFTSKSSGMTKDEQDMVLQGFNTLNEKSESNAATTAQIAESVNQLTATVNQLNQSFASLQTKLSTEPVPMTVTPPAGVSHELADC